jgi:hypothetical protein
MPVDACFIEAAWWFFAQHKVKGAVGRHRQALAERLQAAAEEWLEENRADALIERMEAEVKNEAG